MRIVTVLTFAALLAALILCPMPGVPFVLPVRVSRSAPKAPPWNTWNGSPSWSA